MRYRILLVDDHPHYLSSLRQLLETSIPATTVITAGDGSNGLLLARVRRST
ncbi:MAG: hypothetical protein HC822_01325 [Oscillochloris sp.]|nr:hypothetical protein [Oscillochloris sp.]